MARILLIEDNPEIRSATQEFLIGEGHDVIIAGSAEEGRTMINKNLDVLIFDVVLPGISGWDLCEQIKMDEDQKDIPVIMLTSKITKKHFLKSKVCGAATHINKPFKFSELVTAINDVLK